MERTAGLVRRAATFERYEVIDHLHDVRGIEDLRYRFLWNHPLLVKIFSCLFVNLVEIVNFMILNVFNFIKIGRKVRFHGLG